MANGAVNQNPFGVRGQSKRDAALSALAANEKMLARFLADNPAKRQDPEVVKLFDDYRKYKDRALGGLNIENEGLAWLRRCLINLTDLIRRCI
jgi:hypothetical protein